MGDGILSACTLPIAAPITEAPEAKPAAAKVDLSAFSSMLKTKWKTGSASNETTADKTKAGKRDVEVGQVRSFKITGLDKDAKTVKLDLAG